MRAEYAETKVSADSKLAEARSMMEDALKKLSAADAKMLAAESLEAEAGRYHSAAERKLHEVEAREDDLRRRISSFKTEYVITLSANTITCLASYICSYYPVPVACLLNQHLKDIQDLSLFKNQLCSIWK